MNKLKLMVEVLKITGIILLVAYVGLAVFAWIMADKMVFPAPVPSYVKSANIMMLPLHTGGEVAALTREDPEGKFWMIYCHGNGEDIGHVSPGLNELVRHGWSVIAVDYPGYGQSAGPASEAGCYASIDAAYLYLTAIRGVAPEHIIAYGRSLGGGPAIYLAASQPIGGLILEATFTSAFRVMLPVNPLPFDRFENLHRAPQVSAPVLIMHGRLDGVIPFKHGGVLLNAFPGPKQHLWVDLARHNDLPEIAGNAYWQALETFRETVLAQTQHPR